MKYTLIFWILCGLWAVILVRLWPVDTLAGHILRYFPWFFGLRIVKYFLFRRVARGSRFERKETVLVTGASCGIGAQIASELAERGGKVIWTARDVVKAHQVLDDIQWTYYHGKRGYVLYLDLASKAAIKKSVEEFKKREEGLSCVVLNAAYHGPKRLTADGFEQNIGVNHLGHMYLVYLLLDMVIKSAPSRIVVVTSDLHKLVRRIRFDDLMQEKSYSTWNTYNHSKLLNILFARELARRLKGSGVTVYAAHPGTPILSELMRDSWLGWSLLNELILRPVCFNFCRSPYEGSLTPVYCAVAPECANETGKYYENSKVDKPSPLAEDDAAGAKLWDISCSLLNIPQDWVETALNRASEEKS